MSFVARFILFTLACWLGALLLATGATMRPGVPALVVLAFSVIVLLFALFYFVRHVLVARLRDIGINKLFGLLIFIPPVNILFLVFLASVPRGGLRSKSLPGSG